MQSELKKACKKRNGSSTGVRRPRRTPFHRNRRLRHGGGYVLNWLCLMVRLRVCAMGTLARAVPDAGDCLVAGRSRDQAADRKVSRCQCMKTELPVLNLVVAWIYY
jgi:hypothetical protein